MVISKFSLGGCGQVTDTFMLEKQLQCHVKTAPTNFHMANLLYPSESYCDESQH